MPQLLSAKTMPLGDAALYSLIGFLIVLTVLLLLVGIFYLSGYLFKNNFFIKSKQQVDVQTTQELPADGDEETVAAITAAIMAVLDEESGGDIMPSFVIKRITRKK